MERLVLLATQWQRAAITPLSFLDRLLMRSGLAEPKDSFPVLRSVRMHAIAFLTSILPGAADTWHIQWQTGSYSYVSFPLRLQSFCYDPYYWMLLLHPKRRISLFALACSLPAQLAWPCKRPNLESCLQTASRHIGSLQSLIVPLAAFG